MRQQPAVPTVALVPSILLLFVAISAISSVGPVNAQIPCELTLPQCNGDCPPGLACGPGPVGDCACLPDDGFPPAGTDLSPSTGIFRVELSGGQIVDTSVSGDLLLQWQDPVIDPGTGQRRVDTEMLAMDLSGFDPAIGNLNVRAGSQFGLPPTFGSVTPISPGSDFPALATFDVFFEVDIPGVATLRNNQPLVMEAVIDQIPPRDLGLQNQSPVQLVDINDPTHIDTLQVAVHWMCPPPFPPPGVPCPVPCDRSPFPVCSPADCPVGQQCVPESATGVCTCVDAFPPAGTDLSPTTGIFHVDATGVGGVDTSVFGETLLEWQDPQTDPATGDRSVQTEMLSMDLSGATPQLGQLNVRAGSLFGLPPTSGSVTPIGPDADFPALATFDVFFEVVVAGVATLRNSQPLVMEAEIAEIPPRNIGLRNASPILITDVLDPTHVDVLQTALHWMCPPPFPPPGIPCPVPCGQAPFPVCSPGDCPPGTCSGTPTATCQDDIDCPAGETCIGALQCVPDTATGVCDCAPGFPPAGTDLSPSVGIFQVDVPGIGPVDTSISGDLLLQWQDPDTDPFTGERTVQTEMLAMDLSGFHPSIGSVNLRAGSQFGLPPTLGSVTPIGSGDFPARASFDVFFEVDVQGLTLRNDQPLVMEADIDAIPPRNLGLRNAAPVELRDPAAPNQVSTLQTSLHWMCPPPFPPPGIPCPVPCDRSPFPVCSPGDCPAGQECVGIPTPDGSGACRCVDPFPPAGTDLSPSTGIFRVDVLGVGPVDADVSGELLLEWQDPSVDPVSGQRRVETEMLSMDLSGFHPSIGSLNVRAGSLFGLQPTLGDVVPLGAGSDFPARASFDVFFEVEVDGTTTLRNDQPLVMEADIGEIPPRNIGLQNAAPVEITDIADPTHIDTIQTALHWMCPPPFPPPGVPCPVPCDRNPFPVCSRGDCPPDRPLCVPDAFTQRCTCVSPFPPGGFDLSPTRGVFEVDVFGIGPVSAAISGESLIEFSDPQTDPVSGQRTVQTEMLSMDLSGASPVLGNLRLRAGTNQGLQPTLGSVVPVGPDGDFPALASFDVFFEVDVDGVTTLTNNQPLVMQAEINEIPPRNLGLRNVAPVELRDLVNPGQISTLQTSLHWMCPPPFPPPGVPCPIPCSANPFPICEFGSCPPGTVCQPDSFSGVCACLGPSGGGAGDVFDAGPLRLSKLAGGGVQLDWGPSCLATDNDYEVYEGSIPNYYSHGQLACSTGGATTFTVGASASSSYYLVVPQNGSDEGSYGPDSGGNERPTGTPACRPQLLGSCP